MQVFIMNRIIALAALVAMAGLVSLASHSSIAAEVHVDLVAKDNCIKSCNACLRACREYIVGCDCRTPNDAMRAYHRINRLECSVGPVA